MPIRMVEDKPEGNRRRRRTPTNPGGNMSNRSGGGLISMLLPLLLKKPKLILLALAIFAVFYFLSPDTAKSVVSNVFSTGMQMSPVEYSKAEIFEPLADNKKNPLPTKVSLLKYAPKRLNQGKQGSCVGWASSYAARTILYSKQTGANPNQVAFSPSSLYNEINLPNCQGAYVHTAMKTMKNQGVLPFNQFPYNENSCENELNRNQENQARQYTINGFNRLTKGSNSQGMITDLLAIKQNLAQGAPVVVGMMVGGSFMQNMKGKDTWIPTDSDYQMRGFGGHALCVIAYDDFKDGGSFQIMNSWGEEWGNKGNFWVNYNDFAHFNKEAYGLYPMGDSKGVEPTTLDLEIGLILNSTKQNIKFNQTDKYLFSTTKNLKKGEKFKIEVTNNATCYTYIFGQESDKSSYVLFPYTKKHSPYCGIVGTRLFPRDYSMQIDDIGNKDYMAVLITKSPIDFDEVNQQINNSQGATYYHKILNFLAGDLIKPNFKSENTISFSGKLNKENALAIVMEINKQ